MPEGLDTESLSRALAPATALTPLLNDLRPPSRMYSALRSGALLVLSDVVAITVSLYLASGVHPGTVVYAAALPLWLAALGRYRTRLRTNLQVDIIPLVGALAAPMLVLSWLPGAAAWTLVQDTPRLATAVLIGRLLAYKIQQVARARTKGEPTLIVGAGALGCRVADALLEHPAYGLAPVGFVDGFPDGPELPLPIVGDIDNFDEAVRRTGAIRAIVAFGANRESEIVSVLRASAASHVEIHIIPRLFELGVTPEGPDTDMVWGFPLQHARRAALRTPAWRTKRVMDVVVSSAMIVVTSPILLAAVVAVRLSSPGPILFRQDRVGQRGRVVQILKFRSMRVNDESDTRWGRDDDDRITTVGRVLRLTDIDELPQLFNVLKGDMSLVGPRPERPTFFYRFDQEIFRYRDRWRVQCGLTGWAQIHGLRGDTSIEERARFDNYYIEHWSLLFDCIILARTIWHVLARAAGGLRRKP